ncbi:hypothetical protein TrVFT333_005308 [Trichoderma virens FT-333]|nr:hypothetical protein TrVFT333_005308 [Trichoderma virens FT-333]
MASRENKASKHKIIGIKQPNRNYVDRYAVRVVALNDLGQIALIHAKEGSYFKLPGGGIDSNEDHQAAAAREVQEETGAIVSFVPTDGDATINIPTAGCIATTEEFRNDLHQISYCYFAKVVNTTGKPNLTEDEIVDGLSHEWVTVEKALDIMSTAEPTSELGCYIQERDTYLLSEAKELMEATPKNEAN